MASRGVNKAILIGNLGADPEMRYTQGGKAVANLRLATSRRWKDRNSGEQQEHTEWHRVVLFDKLGEIAGEYLKKGSQVYIEGHIQTRKWQGQDGQDRYTTEIVAENMQMLGGRGEAGGFSSRPESRGNDNAEPADVSGAPLEDDDIPF